MITWFCQKALGRRANKICDYSWAANFSEIFDCLISSSKKFWLRWWKDLFCVPFCIILISCVCRKHTRSFMSIEHNYLMNIGCDDRFYLALNYFFQYQFQDTALPQLLYNLVYTILKVWLTWEFISSKQKIYDLCRQQWRQNLPSTIASINVYSKRRDNCIKDLNKWS